MATESGPLDEVRLEELLRILEFKKSCSSVRRERFQTKLRSLKERQECLQQRIVTRLNKDGVNVDMDTIKRKAIEAALFAAHGLDEEDDVAPDANERSTEIGAPHDIFDDIIEDKMDEHEVPIDPKKEEVQMSDTKGKAGKSGKDSAKGTSDVPNKKLENIQEETTEVQKVSKVKSEEIKEKKPVAKGTKRPGEKRFRKVAQATKFVTKVSKRKTSTSQKLKESKLI